MMKGLSPSGHTAASRRVDGGRNPFEWIRSTLRVLGLVIAPAVLFGHPLEAHAEEIAFDQGGEQVSTVIGFYSPQNAKYILATDFSIMTPQALQRTTIRIHAHVGSRLQPAGDETTPRVAVRVNRGAWHWKSLVPYQDDGHHWIDVPVPAGEWKAGLNRVEVNSNVNSPANRTPETLDLLGCTTPPLQGRASFSLDEGETHTPLTDRNWGIRLEIEELPNTRRPPARLELHTDSERAAVNEPVQYILKAYDAEGEPVSAAEARWSASGGAVDPWGLFRPSRTGRTVVHVALGELEVERAGEAFLKTPLGIEPPDSGRRLKATPPEDHLSLSGPWDFCLDPDNRGEEEEWYRPDSHVEWSEIVVPGVWQAQGYGLDYHGTAWYRRILPTPKEGQGKYVWVRFHGAATRATVWLNGSKIGEHLGNWAPFTLSLAEHWNPSGENVLAVRVEELPSHFSAGFPREIGRMAGCDSHFGGLWQDVTLFTTNSVQIDDLYIHPRLADEQVRVRTSLRAHGASPSSSAQLICTLFDPDGRRIATRQEEWSLPASGATGWSNPEDIDLTFDIPDPQVWSPQSPALYTARVEVYQNGQMSHRCRRRFGMRSVERRGTQILLNGKPLMVRGVLHWAYYPDLFNIDPSEERIRREFRDLRACGFNLVKVCLFVFPRRFYEIADETGMLLWQEYPTWLYVNFPQAGDTRLDADFAREYPEWFRFDRGYPSIILRDLTCEAHINPNFDLLERTYRIGKEMTDGAMLCDNSSFFKHRITDWYVCHTYRDLDDYYQYFATLVSEMRAQPETKPFLFGEDFDADTYRDSKAIRERFMREGTPWWLDNANFEGQLRFDEELQRSHGPKAPLRLVAMQKRHAFALRKAYIEEFRRYPEPAGFVMTSLRDITVTRPGFYDDLGQPKWSPEAWKRFNADRVLVLHMKRRSRCFRADERIEGTLILSNYGADLKDAPLRWTLTWGDKKLAQGKSKVTASQGEILTVARLEVNLGDMEANTASPLIGRLEAVVGAKGDTTRNDWKVWIFPTDQNAAMAADITIHSYSSHESRRLAEAYPGLPLIPVRPREDDSGGWTEVDAGNDVEAMFGKNIVLLTDTIDDAVLAAVRLGTRAVYLAEGDESAFLPRREAPFWRETAIWLPEGPVLGDFPQEDFVDLQFLDLTQRKPFGRSESLEGARPWIWGVNARHPGNGAFDYVVEFPMDRGVLVACCLSVAGENNVAGRHFLRCLIQRTAEI